jgi:hypothetical protein
MTDEDRQIMLAVERFAATVCVPILFDIGPELVDQIGTGTLFDHEGRLLLVTARHLFDDYKPEDLVIPSSNTTALHGIGPYHLYRADVPTIDLAIIELKHPPSIERAQSSWSVLSLDNIGAASDTGHFVMAGYPSIKSKRVGGMLGSTLVSLHTGRLETVPEKAEQPVHPDLDLFFHYETMGETISGDTQAVPTLRGCSGASVWEYREPENMIFWTPEQCLRIVGVQSAYKPSAGYFRAKSWKYVLSMLERQAPEAGGSATSNLP